MLQPSAFPDSVAFPYTATVMKVNCGATECDRIAKLNRSAAVAAAMLLLLQET
jgi:hypothetical protein